MPQRVPTNGRLTLTFCLQAKRVGMATSRAVTAPPLHSLPDLIPAAGEWSRVSRTPATGGRFWTAESSGLTARRSKTAGDLLRSERNRGPGTMDLNLRKKSSSLRRIYGPTKNVIQDDWHQQKRESRSRMGPLSWTGPSYEREDSHLRPLTTNERVPRLESTYKICESTCIPGVGWGELLARDRYCERYGLTPFSVNNGKVEFTPFEPAPEEPRKQTQHPNGKEAAFFDRLRKYKGGNRQQHEREWDSSAVWNPSLLQKDLKGDSFRQSMYKSGRCTLGTWQPTSPIKALKPLAPYDRPFTPSQIILTSLEERQRALAEAKDVQSGKVLHVTGGSWDLSIQQAIGQAGGDSADPLLRTNMREGPKMHALRESYEKDTRELEDAREKEKKPKPSKLGSTS